LTLSEKRAESIVGVPFGARGFTKDLVLNRAKGLFTHYASMSHGVAVQEKMAALIGLDFAGPPTGSTDSVSRLDIFEFCRAPSKRRLAPPSADEIVPAVDQLVDVMNTLAGLSRHDTKNFAHAFSRIREWANAPRQYEGETSLSDQLRVRFVQELFAEIGTDLKAVAALLLEAYDVSAVIHRITNTINYGPKGFQRIKHADHTYAATEEARRTFDANMVAEMQRRGAGESAADAHEQPARKLPKLPKPYCPHHTAAFLGIEAGNGSVFKCTHSKCPHPHLDDAKLRQELKRDKPAAVKFLLDHFAESRIRRRIEEAINKL